MKTSASGIAFIATQEGLVTRAYRDVAGVWTIGVGHTAAAGEPRPIRGMTITRDDAMTILARDLERCEPRVLASLGAASQTVFDGGVSFDFNTGAIDCASWVKAFCAGHAAEARQRLMQWTKAGGREVAGLVRRREAEARLIFEGSYGNDGPLASSSPPPDQIRKVEADLAALGFYGGPVDGIASEAVQDAITSYQRSHPDLVADGIAGPATRASIARDLAARRAAGTSVGSVATTAVASSAAAVQAHASHPWLIAAVAAAVVAAIAAGILARRWHDELKRAVVSTQKDH